ncbi:uncharacterized protein FFNC_15380 [Fusarium fujikuroi]|nr:uncharacterized protein FFNC_15380 [Fusarium fujikuroi]
MPDLTLEEVERQLWTAKSLKVIRQDELPATFWDKSGASSNRKSGIQVPGDQERFYTEHSIPKRIGKTKGKILDKKIKN